VPRKTILALFFFAALLQPNDADPRAESTRKMAELLAQIYHDQDWKADPNKAAERVVYYRRLLSQPNDKSKEVRARFDLAQFLLQAGDSAGAVAEIVKLRAVLKQDGIRLKPDFDRQITELHGLACLRSGEQQNCLENHNAQSCVYPLRGGGLHKSRQGAQCAVEQWSTLLKEGRGTLIDKWLLNLAWMTLGGPPQDAPPDWIIPSSILKSDYDVGRFQDVAPAAGLEATTHSGGSVAEDFDGDGYFDLVISSSGPRDQLRYFHNNGDGTFTDQTHAAGLEGETGGLNVIHADYNNDGRPDLLVLRGGWWGKFGGYPCSLLRNNGPNAQGQITFTDVTVEAGLLSPHPTQTAAWADYDNDGYLDLLLGHETSVDDPYPSELFRNNGDGTFTNVAVELGLADLGYVKGVAWGDFNNDGRPDLYISRKGKPNLLFRNDGPDPAHGWKFTNVNEVAGVSEPVQSFATWFFDYDNDGFPDLLVTGYYIDTLDDIPAFHLGLPNKAEVPRLYHNNGDGTFKDVTKAVGLDRVILAMGVGFGDLDNDGWLDCYFGTGTPDYEALLPNRMFRNDNGRKFQDVTTSGGFGQLQKGHAISFADFNRDGNEDVFEVLGGAVPGDTYMSVLLENPGHANHWLGLKLVGVKSNRSAVGARVRVELNEPQARSIYRIVNSGTSFGDTPFEQHIGLGPAHAIKQVEIQWPAGGKQTFTGLEVDSLYQLREGDAKATLRNIKPFRYLTGAAQMHHEMQ
jgi:hypothetical protein